MRRLLESLFLSLFLLTAPAAVQAGEILEGEGEQIVRDLLKDLKVIGKVGKKNVVGRGASGTLRSLLVSSDTVICGIWQAKQHNLMIELAVKRVPAATYRKAQRLGEIIDRACDKVVNPEAYATGGGGSGSETEPDEDEEEDEESTEPEEPESTDPQILCENQCLSEYREWRKWVRSAEKWQRWLREAEDALKKARADNKKAAKAYRAAKAAAKASRAEAESEKTKAEKAGWPAGSANKIGELLRQANVDEAAVRRLLEAWRDAYAKIGKAKKDRERAIEMRDAMRRYAAEAEAIYRACVEKCKKALLQEGHASAMPATIETLRRFQASDPNRAPRASIAPIHHGTILATPGGRARLHHRIGRQMTSGYAHHVSGAGFHREPERHEPAMQVSDEHHAMPISDEPAATEPNEEERSEMREPEPKPRKPRRRRRVPEPEQAPATENVSVSPLVVEAEAAERREEAPAMRKVSIPPLIVEAGAADL